MEIIHSKSNTRFTLLASFCAENQDQKKSSTKIGSFIEDSNKKELTVFLGNMSKLELNYLSEILDKLIINLRRDYEIDASSFVTAKISEEDFIKLFIERNILINGKSFSKKTNANNIIQKRKHVIISKTHDTSQFSEVILLANQMNEVKYLQDMPANLCTIDFLVDELNKTFLKLKNKNIKIKILDKKEIEDLGMNLILAVNSGSNDNAKILVCEYNNDSSNSNEKIAIVGKGIIFDSGGYNLKRGRGMLGMKYDMSGASIAAYILDTIAQLNVKKNVSIVLPITTNLIDSNAVLPESIITSMSGKTVEIANTDAEGRLILADGLTYASRVLKANLLIDISTLTGSIISALGNFYTGVWSTSDKNWNLINDAANIQNEKVWRMPLDSKYIESLSKKTFADTTSCSNTDYSDCNIAAAWLMTFADGKDYIHFDVAGTADIKEIGKSPMLKTIVEFIKKY